MNIPTLRRMAVLRAFPPLRGLAQAIEASGFVQADPIRAPARAQDLILRHRVTDYRAGELEWRYPKLDIEEGYLYAYGFMPARVRELLVPRHDPEAPDGRFVPSGLASDVLAFVCDQGPTHPAALEKQFGAARQINGWGGLSKATTRALDMLLHHGLLRVARRDAGIRVYEIVPAPQAQLDPTVRLERLVLLVASALAPVATPTLTAATAHLARTIVGPKTKRDVVGALIRSGALEADVADGVRYLWPAIANGRDRIRGGVRFLAPFDPLVWDRRRFEHLWGWPYRFEAYTPPSKRRMGYYAMPLLWGSEVIGWVNCTQTASGGLDVKAHFVDRKPGANFHREFEAEVERMRRFLGTS